MPGRRPRKAGQTDVSGKPRASGNSGDNEHDAPPTPAPTADNVVGRRPWKSAPGVRDAGGQPHRIRNGRVMAMSSGWRPGPVDGADDPGLFTVGVEEEYLLVDPHTGAAVAAVDAVFDAAAGRAARSGAARVPAQPDRDRQPPALELTRSGHVARPAPRGRWPTPPSGPAPGWSPSAPPRRRRRSAGRRQARATTGCGSASASSPPAPASTACTCTSASPTRRPACRCSTTCGPWLPISPGRDRQLAVLRRPRTPGTRAGARCCGSAGPPVGPTPYLESHEQYETLVSTWSPAARCSTRECSTGTPGCPRTTRPSRSGWATSARPWTTRCCSPRWPAALVGDHPATTSAPAGPRRRAAPAADGRALAGRARRAGGPEHRHGRPGEPRPAWQLMRQLFDYVEPRAGRHGDLETVTACWAGCARTAPARPGSGRCARTGTRRRRGRLTWPRLTRARG